MGSCIPSGLQAATINYTAKVSQVGPCASCSVSTDARCSSTFLASVFGRFSSVFAAYCTDSYLVVLTSAAGPEGGSSYYLDSVPNPPGGTNSSNSAECKTRKSSLTASWKTNVFPLNPVLYPSAAYSNNYGLFAGPANGDGGPFLSPTTNETYWLPASGRVGITVSGQEMYPIFNNRALFTNENCETDACNEHIGQGLGQPHLHGDPFGPTCLYNGANYTNAAGAMDWTVHPPIIGISDDGLWIYGRYLSAAAPGGGVALDICGGHSHSGYSYHYHTQIIAATSTGLGSGSTTAGLAYPQTSTGPLYCWMGNLSANAAYGQQGPTAPGPPCCCTAASQRYVQAGYALTLNAAGCPTASLTATGTQSATPTGTQTATQSATQTATLSQGASPSVTVTATESASTTPSSTAASSPTRSAGATPTSTTVASAAVATAALRYVVTISATVPQQAASTAGNAAVLSNVSTSVASVLGCASSWITASTSSLSRRRALQQVSSITWYALVVAPAGTSPSVVTALTTSLGSVSTTITTAAMQPAFIAMATAASLPAGGFSVTGASSAPSTAGSGGDAASASTQLSTGAIVGIAVGSAVGVALIIAGIVAVCTARARKGASAAAALHKVAPPGVNIAAN